jgi:hypothetical protein
MNDRNLQEGQWKDRRQWNLGVGQPGRKFWNRLIYCIYIRENLCCAWGLIKPERSIVSWHKRIIAKQFCLLECFPKFGYLVPVSRRSVPPYRISIFLSTQSNVGGCDCEAVALKNQPRDRLRYIVFCLRPSGIMMGWYLKLGRGYLHVPSDLSTISPFSSRRGIVRRVDLN